MTDAREIIRIAAEDKMKFDGFSSYDEMAAHLIDALTASGFRILGPDEVDQVTVEKCAEIALSYVNQTDYDLEPEAAVAENVTAKMIAAAIRTIGMKA